MPSIFFSRLTDLLGYVLFMGCLAASALALGRSVAVEVVEVMPELQAAAANGPSRVDRFLHNEVASRRAPQIPVPRVLVAYSVPDVPAPILAARLDQAESSAVPTRQQKRRTAVRTARADQRKHGRSYPGGKLPATVVLGEILTVQAGPGTTSRSFRNAARLGQLESTRDITHRNLGIVAVLN